jgi:ferrochelatase
MPGNYQAVLLIAFGGPASREEIRPFLERVTNGIAIPPARLAEVARHYEAVGGKSPLTEITFRQAEALKKLLAERRLITEVFVGMRNSRPFFTEALAAMTERGINRALGFILSSHRTEASWERYQQNIAEARAELSVAPQIDYCDNWHTHPLFIDTWVESIQSTFAKLAPEKQHTTPLIFTAHSLPTGMAVRSPYVQQLEASCRLIADKLGHKRWSIAYQSRSGQPGDSWLEPDIGQAIRSLAAAGITGCVVVPVGFVADHVEVLYDLDIEAKQIAQGLKVTLIRASCPNDHPKFIAMMADVIAEKLKARIEDRDGDLPSSIFHPRF